MKFYGKAIDNAEATLTLNATAKGWIHISGGCTNNANYSLLDLTTSNDFTSLAEPEPEDLDDVWTGVAFEGLVLHEDFEADFHPTEPSHEIVQGIGDVSFQLGIPGLLKAEVNFTLLFHGLMNDTKSADFTYGFDVHVSKMFALTIIRNLTTTTPDPTFTFQSAFRPQISYHAETDFLDDQYDASVFADIPALYLRVSQVHNVDAKCEPAPVGAPDTDVFADLTHITPSVWFDLMADDNRSLSVLASLTEALPTSCLEFFAKLTRLAAPPKREKENGGSALGASSVGRLFGFFLGVFVVWG
ncbi:hypothetical protein HYFRA_00009548 [Hymenoscyphus fraxineus]|uniref:Uncharacterized protein n=1 Tax=Hymenoscyphus fraxineus TaxID=746836 RepID=A0A9N9PJB2_9HELO|nr:hypothetical protein HYFRA_00009548 [Hymenoscyphus fraxineus]